MRASTSTGPPLLADWRGYFGEVASIRPRSHNMRPANPNSSSAKRRRATRGPVCRTIVGPFGRRPGPPGVERSRGHSIPQMPETEAGAGEVSFTRRCAYEGSLAPIAGYRAVIAIALGYSHVAAPRCSIESSRSLTSRGSEDQR
jgi:hypothetical protein